MIDTKELRIGNTIMYNGKVIHINGVVRNTIHYDKNYFDSNIGGYKPFEPIPITEEWLVRFGFEKIDHGFNKYPLYIYPIRDLYYRAVFPIIFDINYVHQLQNIYHSLTGKELELT